MNTNTLKKDKKEKSSVHLIPSERIDFKKWKLPSNYGVVINDILKKGKTLNEANLSFICRRVVDSIEEFSLCPCGDSLRKVVQHMFERYPSTQINPDDTVSSSVCLEEHILVYKQYMHCKCCFLSRKL